MDVSNISNFEEDNAHLEISVNVFILKKQRDQKKEKDVYIAEPFYCTESKKKCHCNLLLIEENYEYEEPRGEKSYYDCDEYDLDEDTEIMKEQFANLEESIIQARKKQKIIQEPPKYHYAYITNLGKLVGAQASKHKTKKEICDRCLHYFYSVKDLKKHEEDCSNLNKCKVKLPDSDKKIKFKNFSNQERMPFVIYADFESLLKNPPADIPTKIPTSFNSTKPLALDTT